MRRRPDRGRPGERLSLDRERRGHRVRPRRLARGRRADLSVEPAQVFFGGDSAFGPKNIITAVAHGHEAAISIDAFCQGRGSAPAPRSDDQSRQPEDGHPRVVLRQRHHPRPPLQGAPCRERRRSRTSRPKSSSVSTCGRRSARRSAASTATSRRCFPRRPCIECDACVDICPIDCISFVPNAPEDELRALAQRARAQPFPGDLCLGAGEDRPGDGQGRGSLPALRALRRALSDWRLGHA